MNISEILKRLAAKISKVFDAGEKAGKDAEWSAFWDAYQNKGKQNSWAYAFYGSYWNDVTFKPKYDITFNPKMNNYTQVFRGSQITNLKGILEEQDVTLDTSGCSGSNPIDIFYNCYYLTHVPTLDVSNLSNGVGALFLNCSALLEVEKMILSEAGTKFTSQSFQGCKALEEIRFEGKIASDIDFGDCEALSKNSIESIINALSDTTTGMTVTLYLTSSWTENEEIFWELIATKPNWTLAWT